MIRVGERLEGVDWLEGRDRLEGGYSIEGGYMLYKETRWKEEPG